MPPRSIDPATVQALADRLADYLWGSRAEAGAAVQAAVRQAARRHRMNYSDLWNEVHRVACLRAHDR